MIVVLDVNIILSALIKDSSSRRLLLDLDFDFCFPEPALNKIRKYKDYIIHKAGISLLEYLVVLNILFKFIRVVPTEEILANWNQAKEIMEKIDTEDVVFIATALSQEESIIWSDDKHFEKQRKIKVIKTKDVINLIE